MKLLQRYVFLDIIKTSLFAIGLCVFVLVAGNAVRDILGLVTSGQISWILFGKLLLVLIPYVASYALPLGGLIGVLVVFGRLSAQNELTAMKSAGISLWNISRPVLIFGLIGTLFAGIINFYYAPYTKTIYKQSVVTLLRDNPLQFIQPEKFIDSFPGYIIYAKEKKGNYLKDFWLWELNDLGKVNVFVKAKEGFVTYNENEEALILKLREGFGEQNKHSKSSSVDTSNPMLYFDEFSVKLRLDNLFANSFMSKKISMLTLKELLEELKENKKIYKSNTNLGTREYAYHRIIQLKAQINKNLSMALSVLAMVIIGVPLAIKTNRSETYVNSVIAIGLSMLYYFLMIIISWLEKFPHLRPDILIFLPVTVFFAAGVFLMFKANKN